MNDVQITFSEDVTFVRRNSMRFEIRKDNHTGDWAVVKDRRITYMKTRQGAVNYSLWRCGVLDEKNWERAPDRCV